MSEFRIYVSNSLKKVGRELLVYTYESDVARNPNARCSIVSRPSVDNENCVQFPIPEGGHLIITMAPQHAEIKAPCWVQLRSDAKLEFFRSNGELEFTKSEGELELFQGERIEPLVIRSAEEEKISVGNGPHDWKLKITAPESLASTGDDTVRVGDNG